MNKTKIGLAISLAAFSSGSSAVYTVTQFLPSAELPFEMIKTSINASAASTGLAIEAASLNTTSSLANSSAGVVNAITSTSVSRSSEAAKIAQISTKIELDHQSEMALTKMEGDKALRKGETPEEISFVLELLRRDDLKDRNLSEVVSYMVNNIDSDATVLVKPKADYSGDCADSAGCGTEKKFTPSDVVTYYAEMCNNEKMKRIVTAKKLKSQTANAAVSAKKLQITTSSTSTTSSQAKKISSQLSSSCTPEQMKLGFCSITNKEEYAEKVLLNEIIPNGNISAQNIYTPSGVGGLGYSSLTDEQYELMEFGSLDRDISPMGGVPVIVNTYRNSTQLKSAYDFVDNILNTDAVSNQNPSDRLKASSADYQSMYLSRMASLDLSRSAFNDVISERTGDVLVDINKDKLGEEFIKEKATGAGSLDVRLHQINKDLEMVSPQNIKHLNSMTSGAVLLNMYETAVYGNKMLSDELLVLEKQLLLESTLLAAEVNSAQNIEYMKQSNR